MFRSHWTIISEHFVRIPKLPLITCQYVTLRFCGITGMPDTAIRLKAGDAINRHVVTSQKF